MADRLLALVNAAVVFAKYLSEMWEPWMFEGRCRQGGSRGTRAEDFFPAPNDAPNSLRVRRARRMCIQCPVRQECLAWAFGDREKERSQATRASIADGVYGGTTPRERKAVAHLPPIERYQVLDLWLRVQMTGRFAVASPDEWRSNGNGTGYDAGTRPETHAATAV